MTGSEGITKNTRGKGKLDSAEGLDTEVCFVLAAVEQTCEASAASSQHYGGCDDSNYYYDNGRCSGALVLNSGPFFICIPYIC